MLPRCEVESRDGRGNLKDEEASLSRFVRVELIPAMQDSGIVVPTAPSGQPIMPGIVYVDDSEIEVQSWTHRFDHVLVKAVHVFRKQPDLVMVLLDKDRNCEYLQGPDYDTFLLRIRAPLMIIHTIIFTRRLSSWSLTSPVYLPSNNVAPDYPEIKKHCLVSSNIPITTQCFTLTKAKLGKHTDKRRRTQ